MRLLLALSVLLPAACGFDELTQSGERRPEPAACGECHTEIYAEWQASAHARAFSGETYSKVTADKTFTRCLGCHAPNSVYDEPEIRPRETAMVMGVDCIACHLSGRELAGPTSSSGMVTPHAIREEPGIYLRSELCGRCHEGTYAEWETAGARSGETTKTCQECHMPRVVRTLTQGTDVISSAIVALESEIPQRRHTFDIQVSDFPDVAELEIDLRGDQLLITVRNRLPHDLPTGDFGPRRILARVRFVAGEREVGLTELVWSARHGTAIPPHGSSPRTLSVPPGARRVEVTLVRPPRDAGREIVLATSERELP